MTQSGKYFSMILKDRSWSQKVIWLNMVKTLSQIVDQKSQVHWVSFPKFDEIIDLVREKEEESFLEKDWNKKDWNKKNLTFKILMFYDGLRFGGILLNSI